MPSWWPIPVLLAFLFAAWLTPLARMIAIRFGVMDVPGGERKKHHTPTALMGGLGIIAAFSLVTIGVLFSSTTLTSGAITMWHFAGFFLGILVLTIGGVLDDRYSLPAKYLVCFMVAASAIAVLGGIDVAKMTNPFGGFFVLPAVLASLVAFVWILAMTMTTKLLDGVDGLAATVSMIAAFMIGALALTPTYFQSDVALLALIFAAAILGFLLWNWYPAQVFLGESGSTVLGFTVGVLSVIAGSKMATALLVLGVPAIDVGIVAIRRVMAGKNPFTTADRRHAHLMLRDVGLPSWAVTLVYGGVVTLFGVTTLVFERWQKIMVLGVLAAFSGVGIVYLAQHLAKKQGKLLDDSRRV
jgi:UDP-GlcNAc:undecaprenyl-phosphate/decaprenyl-phosphate GlcNAc-1-phosphate transferase